MDPSYDAPASRPFQPRSRRKNQPLTLLFTAPRSRSPRRGQEPLSPLLRQKERLPGSKRLPSTSARSTPACAEHLEREPATDTRVLPPELGFQRSFALRCIRGRARLRRFRELFAHGRSVPRAARRLLQSKRSTSTTCAPTEPPPRARPRARQPKPCDLEPPRSFARSTDGFDLSFQRGEAEWSRVRG